MRARLLPLLPLLSLLAACGSRPEGPAALNDPAVLGEQTYRTTCQTCHGREGQGVPGAFPPLAGSARLTGAPAVSIRIVLHGLRGPLDAGGQRYDGVMTPHGTLLSDDQIAAVLTFARSQFGNDAPPITPEAVAAERVATQDQTGLYTAETLAR